MRRGRALRRHPAAVGGRLRPADRRPPPPPAIRLGHHDDRRPREHRHRGLRARPARRPSRGRLRARRRPRAPGERRGGPRLRHPVRLRLPGHHRRPRRRGGERGRARRPPRDRGGHRLPRPRRRRQPGARGRRRRGDPDGRRAAALGEGRTRVRGRARVPATCGELLQGVDPRGPVLVSLPVDRWGSVEVALVDAPDTSVEPHRPRAATALRLAVEACGWDGGARARLGGEVPPGHGLGSSTVDVAGVLCATFAAAGRALGAAELMRLAAAVEPTDTSPLSGLWAVDHTGGGRLRRLGPAPDAWVASVDGGGSV
ncbi:MAG: hypothetical protein E6I76_13025, partial [Chloroflexi bacterium]